MGDMGNKVISVRSDSMGEGNPALGQVLLGTFFRLLMESPAKPKAVFFYNAGVKLLCGDSPVLSHLQMLAEQGVPLQACTTCVDSYGIRETMPVGELSSMGQLVEYMQEYEIVTI